MIAAKRVLMAYGSQHGWSRPVHNKRLTASQLRPNFLYFRRARLRRLVLSTLHSDVFVQASKHMTLSYPRGYGFRPAVNIDRRMYGIPW